MMYDYLETLCLHPLWVLATMRNMMMTMTTEITLVLSGYHARGLEAIPAKCAVGGIFIHSLEFRFKRNITQ